MYIFDIILCETLYIYEILILDKWQSNKLMANCKRCHNGSFLNLFT